MGMNNSVRRISAGAVALLGGALLAGTVGATAASAEARMAAMCVA